MSPYPSQTKPVVLTAWGVQLVIDSLPDDRIAKFITSYEQGPQNPKLGTRRLLRDLQSMRRHEKSKIENLFPSARDGCLAEIKIPSEILRRLVLCL
jgi:hypothetical protein